MVALHVALGRLGGWYTVAYTIVGWLSLCKAVHIAETFDDVYSWVIVSDKLPLTYVHTPPARLAERSTCRRRKPGMVKAAVLCGFSHDSVIIIIS